MSLKQRRSTRYVLYVALSGAIIAAARFEDASGAPTPPPEPMPGIAAGFEIDGNQQCGDADTFAGLTETGDDWADGNACDGQVDPVTDPLNAAQFTDCNWGNQGDAADSTQFKGHSNKNDDLIDGGSKPWQWGGQGGGPQKNDITNVYLERREADGKDWLIFGAETRATDGDSHIDFEINQAGIMMTGTNLGETHCAHGQACCDSDESGLLVGKATGPGTCGGRTDHDIILSMDFQKGGVQPTLAVRFWNAATCSWDGPYAADDYPNAIFSQTNAVDIAPGGSWTGFTGDGAESNVILALQFVEGAIDQTTLNLEFHPCIPEATMLVKTRSSDSFTAELKDFALIPFPDRAAPMCEPNDVCLGEELCADATGGEGPYTCAWSGPGVLPINGECCFTPTEAGDFTVIVSDANTCVSESCGAHVGTPNTADAGPDKSTCREIGAASCVTLSGSGTGGSPSWTQIGQTTTPGDCEITIENGDTYSPTVCFADGCSGSAEFELTVSGDAACDAATDQAVATIHGEPSCDLSNAAVTKVGEIHGGTVSGGTAPYTCSATFNAASGWSATSCTVTDGNIVVLFDVDASQGLDTAELSVEVTDANGCGSSCSQQVAIDVSCSVDPVDPICETLGQSLTATANEGLDGQTIEWFGPFAGVVDCAGQTLESPIETCSDLSIPGTCTLDVDTSTPGTSTYCARNTEPHGFSSLCQASTTVYDTPACSLVAPSARMCAGESVTICAEVVGGTPPYQYLWNTGDTSECITVSPVSALSAYSAVVSDDHGCISSTCETIVEVEGCACRVTGGGVDGTIPPNTWADGEDANDQYTFGGQAGAPTESQPQPYGEWTHRQQKGRQGQFTFHAGTASAPDGTYIKRILCHDPDNCSPARPAPSKQIDFEGVGSFQNIGKGNFLVARFADAPNRTLHWFEVHIEDLGEPGNQNADAVGTDACPFGGHADQPNGDEKCGCPDFYHIRIYENADEANPGQLIYEVQGYINGGNLQIHPPIGG